MKGNPCVPGHSARDGSMDRAMPIPFKKNHLLDLIHAMYARRIRSLDRSKSRARFTPTPMHSRTRVPWDHQMIATAIRSISFPFFVLVVGLLLGKENKRKTQGTPTMRCIYLRLIPSSVPLTHVTTHDSTALDGLSCFFCLVGQDQGTVGPW